MNANYNRVADFERDLRDFIAREVKRLVPVSDAQAIDIGSSCARKVRHEYRGSLVYFPKGTTGIDKRDRELVDYYRSHGNDIFATARHFELCVQTVYKRIRVVDAAELNARQGGLFEVAENDVPLR